MNINEVHWTFSDNGTKEPAKPYFEMSVTFEPFGVFWCGFHLCSGEWALSFNACVLIYFGVSLNLPTISKTENIMNVIKINNTLIVCVLLHTRGDKKNMRGTGTATSLSCVQKW